MTSQAKPEWDINFQDNLRKGEAREDAFVYVFLKSKVEHKHDKKYWQTGNICIEYMQKGRPSGISTSQADWYAIEFLPQRWIILTLEAVKDLARKAINEGRHTNTGDNGNHSALIPIEWFVDPKLTGPQSLEKDAEGFEAPTAIREAA